MLKKNKRPCWIIQCDKCGEHPEGDFTPHYETKAEAIQNAKESDWQIKKDGTVLCDDCRIY